MTLPGLEARRAIYHFQKEDSMETKYALGWYRDLPDINDWDITEHPMASQLILRENPLFPEVMPGHPLLLNSEEFAGTPGAIDLSRWCSPIENQGKLGSCTAQAALGAVEYLERRALGRHVDGSRLFTYKVTRNLLGWEGDTGAYVRTTIQSLAKVGVPPERYWPYDVDRFDAEPSAFVYSLAASARALNYFRLDGARSREALLSMIKRVAAMGLPSQFGFVVYDFGNEKGEFTVPEKGARSYGGHAVLCVGYDDSRIIGNSLGALKIRNSWGTKWGEKGYGWLPYDYVLRGLTADWWVIMGQDYIGD
jgi:C1A family cysteine protease